MWNNWKRKIQGLAGLIAAVLLLSGCGGAELENKTFPLAVVIAQQKGSIRSAILRSSCPKWQTSGRTAGIVDSSRCIRKHLL